VSWSGATISEVLIDDRPISGSVTFLTGDGRETIEWSSLRDDAIKWAGALQSLGLEPGDRVALVGFSSRSFVTALQAVWHCGATVSVLPLPSRFVDLQLVAEGIGDRIGLLRPSVVIIDPQLAPLLPDVAANTVVVDTAALAAASKRTSRLDQPAADSASLAVIQFTSGSTGEQKMTMISHRNVLANIGEITTGMELSPGRDIAMSWLPLYHDMGLFGFLMTLMLSGTDLVLASPEIFARRPQDWMRWVSDFRASIIGAPNFAYALATRTLRTGRFDLSCVRIAFNGAESICPETVETFCSAASNYGFDPGAMFCVYGMAEATLAVSFPTPGRGMMTDYVDADKLEHHKSAVRVSSDSRKVRRLVLLGSPLPGLKMRIVDPDDCSELSERRIGEVQIRGDAVTSGYLDRPDLTATSFDDGWFHTGDLGYLAEGELVICGRLKDIIIVGGRNIAPEEVERTVGRLPGVRQGSVIAFGVPGTERESVVVALEAKAPSDDLHEVVAKRVRDDLGIRPHVVVLPPHTLPKTSSGKLQRQLARELYLDGGLVADGVVGESTIGEK
jgi:fatty-acyl-CoA synthase